MAEKVSFAAENEPGCGLLGALFQRGGLKLRKAYSVPPLPQNRSNNKDAADKHQGTLHFKNGCGSVCDMALLDSSKPAKTPAKLAENVPRRTSVRTRSSLSRDQTLGRRHSDASRKSTSSQVVSSGYNTRKLSKEQTIGSGDLSSTLAALPKSNASERPYGASTGNIMRLGHLGNLKHQAKQNSSSNSRSLHNSPRTLRKKENMNVTTGATFNMGNILKKPTERNQQFSNMYCSVMNKLDPDLLKSMGNQKYKQGRLEEALALYNQAIALDSSKAAYFSNKSAALMGLGHLIEAVFGCIEAIRIEPNYQNAHYRLAKLYLRLGEAEKALCHFKNSGEKASRKDIAEAQALKTHLRQCSEAQKLRDWKTLLNESHKALCSGADSAPQMYAMKAEALLKLQKHEEAYNTLQTGPAFDTELSTRLFGSACSAYSLITRSLVYMAAGRFEDAVAAAHDAARLDSSYELNLIVKKVQAVMKARLHGNRLFKASKFVEASVAYTEGLEQEPYNAVLLCNRAACRSKQGQYEKAVEDCSAALSLCPSYQKARLRRADCNAKMERWKAAILDYEVLMQGNPKDEELHMKLLEANRELHKLHNEGIREPTTICSPMPVSSYEHLTLVAANHAACKC